MLQVLEKAQRRQQLMALSSVAGLVTLKTSVL